jgi:hypothetical protein
MPDRVATDSWASRSQPPEAMGAKISIDLDDSLHKVSVFMSGCEYRERNEGCSDSDSASTIAFVFVNVFRRFE